MSSPSSSKLGKPIIIEASVPPVCSSCHKLISPDEKGVSFLCPNCGAVSMWRCEKCRKQSNLYRCPNCGFEGP